MRSVRFVLAAALAASAMGGAVALAVPAQAAKEKLLVVVPAATSVPSTERVALSAKGGPSKGKLKFDFEGGGCGLSLDGKFLDAAVNRASTCKVWALKVNSKGKALAKSKPVKVKFTYTPPVKRAFNGQPCTIVGTPKADVLRGTPGDDVICGLGGNDRIIGRAGDDVLDGGNGLDSFNGGTGDNLCDYDAGEQQVGTCRYDDSPPEMSLTVSPSVVDATLSGAETHMTLALRDEVGLRRGQLECRREGFETVAKWRFEVGVAGFTGPDDGSFAMWQEGQVLPEDRWTWTADRDGMTFELRLPIGRASESGPITCYLGAEDRLGHESYVQVDKAFAVTVEAGAAEPVVVNSLTMSPSVIDMSKSRRQATATIVVDSPSGVDDVQTGCSPQERAEILGVSGFGLSYLSGGNALPYENSASSYGPYDAVFTISQSGTRHVLHYTWQMRENVPNGTYDCWVAVVDGNGQRVTQEFADVITVEDVGGRDLEGPTLSSVTLSPNVVDVGRKAKTVTISLDLADPAGVSTISLGCGRLSSTGTFEGDRTLSFFARLNDVIANQWIIYSGRPGVNRQTIRIDGVDGRRPHLDVPVTIPFGYEPDTYSCYVTMQDSLGNYSHESLPDLLTVKRTWA